jgi:energy-coupling factor transporter ATP-binding protein EcfA2
VTPPVWLAAVCREVVGLLRELKKEATLLVVSHDLADIAPLVDCAWRMQVGGSGDSVACANRDWEWWWLQHKAACDNRACEWWWPRHKAAAVRMRRELECFLSRAALQMRRGGVMQDCPVE